MEAKIKKLASQARLAACSKGGKSHSREHMAEIGRKGGRAISSVPGHMSAISKLSKERYKMKDLYDHEFKK